MYYELADTLIALVTALEPPAGTGMFITEASLEVPLEVSGAVEHGTLLFYASPPHTRWVSGVLPVIHRTTMQIVLNAEFEGAL
jgi:hypothetical protein